MLKTLQAYVSRELLKNFLLTSFGLTLTFSLTGGVFNMLKAEALTAVQMVHLIIFVIPVSLTLTLPVAALFSCAMVYGRLASDNEFDACRASGVNIHRLLLPAFGLSLITAGFTFVSANYLLPRSIKELEGLVAKDLQKVVVSALNMQGYFKQLQYIVHAGEPPEVRTSPEGAQVHISGAAFIQVDNESLIKVGTADSVNVDFWADPVTGDPIAQPAMYGIRAFDFEQNKLWISEGQKLDPLAVPMLIPQKTKWLNLNELLYYRNHPTDLAQVKKNIGKLRSHFRDALFYKYVVEELNAGEKVLRLNDVNGRLKYEVRAERATHDEMDFQPRLEQVRVKYDMGDHVRHYTAESCSIKSERGFAGPVNAIHLRVAGKVSFTDSQYPNRPPLERRDEDLDVVPMPKIIIDEEQKLDDMHLLAIDENMIRLARSGKLRDPPPFPYHLGARIEGERDGALAQIREESLQVVSNIHSRLAFSASSMVMLILAAALAVIFRGGQILTAFVISFIPGMLVVVMNITGRQLAERPETHLTGLIVIWAAIGLVAFADSIVLMRFLRR